MTAALDAVLKMAEALDFDEQEIVIERLRSARDRATRQHIPNVHAPTREDLLRKLEALQRNPPKAQDSLWGKYANPNVVETSADSFHAELHSIISEWEQELDEFYAEKP